MTKEEFLKYGLETGFLKFSEYLELTKPLNLPEGLEEAAEEWCGENLEGKEAWSYGPSHYDFSDVVNTFIAGAEWMAGQGVSIEGTILWHDGPYLDYTDEQLHDAMISGGIEVDDDILIQIIKK